MMLAFCDAAVCCCLNEELISQLSECTDWHAFMWDSHRFPGLPHVHDAARGLEVDLNQPALLVNFLSKHFISKQLQNFR